MNEPSTSLDAVLAKLDQLIQAQSNVAKQLGSVLPLVQTTATSATAGGGSLPASPAGFLVVTNPITGQPVKVPFYNP